MTPEEQEKLAKLQFEKDYNALQKLLRLSLEFGYSLNEIRIKLKNIKNETNQDHDIITNNNKPKRTI